MNHVHSRSGTLSFACCCQHMQPWICLPANCHCSGDQVHQDPLLLALFSYWSMAINLLKGNWAKLSIFFLLLQPLHRDSKPHHHHQCQLLGGHIHSPTQFLLTQYLQSAISSSKGKFQVNPNWFEMRDIKSLTLLWIQQPQDPALDWWTGRVSTKWFWACDSFWLHLPSTSFSNSWVSLLFFFSEVAFSRKCAFATHLQLHIGSI